jgi:hypothetical protein
LSCSAFPIGDEIIKGEFDITDGGALFPISNYSDLW